MLRTSILTLALLLLLATPALADGTATLYGAVHDHNTPLIGAQVTIIGEATYTSRSTQTNENGVYYFDKLPTDEYIISAIPQPAGLYKDGSANVFVGKGKEKEVNFPMVRK